MAEQVEIHAEDLHWLLETLVDNHGQQDWWPAESFFEILVGAVLTQNTAWSNVEKAIANLRQAQLLDPEKIIAVSDDLLTAAIKPSGYFNIKAQRLRNLCQAYLQAGGYSGMAKQTTDDLRSQLLQINGVGRETADDILLYAFARPVFVVDAYTRRILSRLDWISGEEHYESLRRAVEFAIGPDRGFFNELHAQIVMLGKDTCRPKPRCTQCPLISSCAYPRQNAP
ncbi:endonuclease III domain-containing protein [Halorhodospira halochloris]|uniref:endonuclease III domain-containing protein n=1 Tax=Halorhodospira halochloris TaxID=1052 RepID=UPI001EE7C744|nr:endonuclease [Halorhodospira halochloris]MCG5548546.1 endonuclease [Halorhodospira halochloris]